METQVDGFLRANHPTCGRMVNPERKKPFSCCMVKERKRNPQS